jgi:uncharacterized membrane protein
MIRAVKAVLDVYIVVGLLLAIPVGVIGYGFRDSAPLLAATMYGYGFTVLVAWAARWALSRRDTSGREP